MTLKRVANFTAFSVSLLGKLVTEDLTVIFWNIVRLPAYPFINTCSTDLAHILVQEFSGFCSQEFNPGKEINPDNKPLLLPMARGKIFGKKKRLSQFDDSFNTRGSLLYFNEFKYKLIYESVYLLSKCKNITSYKNYQNIKMRVIPECC